MLSRSGSRLLGPLLLGVLAFGCTCGSSGPATLRSISTTPKALDFGSVAGGSTTVLHLTVTNTSKAPLSLHAIHITGDETQSFTVAGSPATLASTATLELAVTFNAPMQVGAWGATLELDSDAHNAPQLLIPLAGQVAASCRNTTCPPNATCADATGVPVCTCGTGYLMQDGVCVDPCAMNNGGCDPNAACAIEGTNVTCTCNPGYDGNGETGMALVCTARNACLANNGGCDPHATCTPQGTGVACACNPGYQGNGQEGTALVCLPMDPCLTNNGGCDANAFCTPDGTQVTCTCKPGYRGNGANDTTLVCVQVSPCAVDNGGCDPNAACTPTGLTTVTCACNPGYEGDGGDGTALKCTPINQCLTNNGGCDVNATCTQQGTKVKCACDLGYTGNGVQCVPTQAGHPSTMNHHVCDIAGDGSLWCWGLNSSGQVGNAVLTVSGHIQTVQSVPYHVAVGTRWLGVAAGQTHTCGIQIDGTLWCWGDNSAGELGTGSVGGFSATPQQVGTRTSWRLVSAGWSSSCAIQADGTLWCWGDNSHGQTGLTVGHGPAISSPSLVSANLGQTWTAVSSGHGFNCGLQSDSSLWCWGAGGSGQLSLGMSADSPLPQRVRYDKYVNVSTGDRDACAVRDDGTLWCWGWGPDFFTTLSVGSATSGALTPVQIGLANTWASVAVNENACAIQTDGSLWCSGPNRFGNLGTGDQIARASLRQVGTFQTWQSVAVGASTCAETTGGRVYCWGSDNQGEIGDGAAAADVPTQVSPGVAWQSVAMGVVRSESLQTSWPAVYGVQTDGTLWEWGGYAPFGTPQILSQLPSLVGVASNWVSVSAGDPTACALDKDGQAWCFGTTDVGNDSNAPTTNATLVNMGGWSNVSVGLYNTCALGSGSLWCWGANADGEFGNGTKTGTLSPSPVGSTTWSAVSMGATHGCGISSGTLSCWGTNGGGELGNGTTTASTSPVMVAGTTWTAVSAGLSHTCGLQQDGSLWCWGWNAAGEVGDGTTSSVTTPKKLSGTWASVATAVDSATTCGVQTNSTLWCWGNLSPILPSTIQSTPRQLGAGSSWSSVATNGGVCAIKSDGTLWCWGDNLYGQRGNGNAWRVIPVPVSF